MLKCFKLAFLTLLNINRYVAAMRDVIRCVSGWLVFSGWCKMDVVMLAG